VRLRSLVDFLPSTTTPSAIHDVPAMLQRGGSPNGVAAPGVGYVSGHAPATAPHTPPDPEPTNGPRDANVRRMSEPVIRDAEERDLPSIATLYDRFVRETAVTFDVEPTGVAGRRAWLAARPRDGIYPVLVAELDGGFAGYAASHPLSAKRAYDSSVELSVYLEDGARRRGVGRKLYETLLARVTERGVHRAYAGVTLPNPASERFHQALGFRAVGTYDEVGFKLGRYWSVRWFERRL
jgi:phosphinothricin acetyltransferase